MLRTLAALLLAAATALLGTPRAAQASPCFAYVERAPGVQPVALKPAARTADTVEITFVGHSTYRIETPAGITIATDYAGRHGQGPLPEVVTMNQAHTTHYTPNPDPGIDHVLRGWSPEGGAARHDLQVADVRIRNVPTDLRGRFQPVEKHGNSIFIFEVADLCIAHLGHLHHQLSSADLGLIGRVDVVMAPVDGRYTLDLPKMIATLRDLRAQLILPMHFFGGRSLDAFVRGMSDSFAIRRAGRATIAVSPASLPAQPTVLVPRREGAR
jgi:L-ascorbate metabolism protein UlaG (beta-lactamase superfamily)